MRPVGVWLERFRRSAGVPAAAGDDLAPELVPVFGALDEIDAEARAIRAAAEAEAARRVDAAAAEGERNLAQWRRRAERERTRAEARERERIAHDAHDAEVDARHEAELVRARGLERVPRLVERVVACIREESI